MVARPGKLLESEQSHQNESLFLRPPDFCRGGGGGGINGIQFCKPLKASRCWLVVNYATRKFAIEGYNLDVVDYLIEKPVAFDPLFEGGRETKAQEPVFVRSKPGTSPDFYFSAMQI